VGGESLSMREDHLAENGVGMIYISNKFDGFRCNFEFRSSESQSLKKTWEERFKEVRK
jgi:hypothetical protein